MSLSVLVNASDYAACFIDLLCSLRTAFAIEVIVADTAESLSSLVGINKTRSVPTELASSSGQW